MGTIGKDFKFKLIKNFLNENEIHLLDNYCKIKHRIHDKFDYTPADLLLSPNADTMFYADPIMESLMVTKQKLMEEQTNKKLLPTYSYWRMYTRFADLKKHIDRPSCEISVTVHIGSDGTDWPIYIAGVENKTNPGDAVVYMGCEVEHYRKEFEGDWYSQVFLHYVDAEGKNKEWYLDKRKCLGLVE